MSLPPFTRDDVLPPGDYAMILEDLRRSFLVTGAGSASETWDRLWRARLVTNLGVLVGQLWQVGITHIFVDGSFAENKDHPNDIDGYFEVEEERIITGSLVEELNALDPHQVWTWNPQRRRPEASGAKAQLPMWHQYRVELYPHFGQPSGIRDEYGHSLLFPAAFRKSRLDHRPKGIIEIVQPTIKPVVQPTVK